jgi:anti-sigma factor RsiW
MPDPQPLTDADRAELVAYLDGELDAEGQQRVEARLSRDALARTEADALKRAWDLLDHLPRAAPSPDFTERTLTLATVQRLTAPASRERQRPEDSSSETRVADAPSPPRPWYSRRAAGYAAWAAAALLVLAAGYRLTVPTRPATPAELDPDTDPILAREPRVIENLPLYLAAENLDYLLALDQPDLFADDAPSR